MLLNWVRVNEVLIKFLSELIVEEWGVDSIAADLSMIILNTFVPNFKKDISLQLDFFEVYKYVVASFMLNNLFFWILHDQLSCTRIINLNL